MKWEISQKTGFLKENEGKDNGDGQRGSYLITIDFVFCVVWYWFCFIFFPYHQQRFKPETQIENILILFRDC